MDNFAERCDVARASLEAQVMKMYETKFRSRSGRWDLEGLKMDISTKVGSANMHD